MGGSAETVRQGPLLVWNGQADIATAINEAGVWRENGRDFSFGNIFDENPNTCWASANSTGGPNKIKIVFKVSLMPRIT